MTKQRAPRNSKEIAPGAAADRILALRKEQPELIEEAKRNVYDRIDGLVAAIMERVPPEQRRTVKRMIRAAEGSEPTLYNRGVMDDEIDCDPEQDGDNPYNMTPDQLAAWRAHPVFGKIAERGAPTPEEAFAMGVAAGDKAR